MQRFIIVFIASLFLYSNYACAEVQLKGGIESQAIYLKSNIQALTANNKYFGINSTAHVNLDIKGKTEQDIEYGAKVGLETTTRNDKRVASSLYLASDYGKVEAGSEKSATANMKITANTIACGTAGAWDFHITLTNLPRHVAFITNFGNFLDGKTREKIEYARKITYYTPKIHGLQLGISFIPDTGNSGNNALSEPTHHTPVKPAKYKFGIKNGVGYGISYGVDATKDLNIKTSFVGEAGKVVARNLNDNNPVLDKKFKPLNSYNIGAELHYKQYSVAGSYANYNKSLMLDNLKTSAYSVGARYKLGAFATSLNYFSGTHARHKTKATSAAVNWTMAPGMLSYFELTYYQAKSGRFVGHSAPSANKATRGTLSTLGLKLEF